MPDTATTAPRPPFDPEFVPFLTALDERGGFHLTTEMLPRMRELGMTEAQLDEGLRARGLERRSVTVPGHLGDPITLAVIQRTGRTGPAACAYAIHGGGMVFGHHLGNLDSYDEWLLVHDVVLVSPDYRLAPEHPDPYPVEDCYAGLVWSAAHADELGIDPERILLVGQSAGGGLAAGTALLARDRGGPEVIGQVLISPMLDDRDVTCSARQFDGVGVADRAMVGFGWDALLGDRRGGDDVSAAAAPARASDLGGLPPAYVDCGSAEVFRDETVAFASALWAAGVQAELHVWPGAFHGSSSMLPTATLSRRATRAVREWTGRLLGPDA
ncbi:alpha/beta hydrolase fold domain-containing protein [Curtobacterium sp. YC1]|uniref:alpha/beta hydrolase n=1 Tax=Curtobacterium sp. YC1 TaxID=2795488 RepID=UPI0018E548E7|nr:alpha/beta hydrolase fold domain-containing protein [Curtobacterium sp. YC1]QQD75072.1 alpha/beta hydrolase fold domain-containing protein [Curtobacterium sp. YC1]